MVGVLLEHVLEQGMISGVRSAERVELGHWVDIFPLAQPKFAHLQSAMAMVLGQAMMLVM